MAVMLERWNDDKMDALDAKIDALDVKVEGLTVRVDCLDRGLGELHRDVRDLQKTTKEGFEAMSRTLVHTIIALTTTFAIGASALAGLVMAL
jgi:hypothetical protein